jgi:hypothetical protein
MMPAVMVAVAAVLGLGSSHRAIDAGAAADQSIWREVNWPFSADPWGAGKAFVCKGSKCGVEARLYLRVKMGLCNCATGIEDDIDLDRMGDLYLTGARAVPDGDGRPIAVAHMKGRSRTYSLVRSDIADARAITIGYSDRCDMVVATAVLPRGRLDETERAVLKFLNSAPVMRWTEASLGL